MWSRRSYSRLAMSILKLSVCGAALQVGAHPDDEDNALLAYLARGVFMDTYYLVATYGEGGQNECGSELYEALGVLRSQELESARRIDGAYQLYMGAHDFGYSKSAADTFTKWDRGALLASTVALLRKYRPDIVLTHHDTVSGHGQHQAVGWIIQNAITAAADPAAFPEQLEKGLVPWRVPRFYVRVPSGQATMKINVGEYSPILGMSFCELGQISRSMHKSQGMGGPIVKGEVFRPYRLVYQSAEPVGAERQAELQAEPEEGLLQSLDLSLTGLIDSLRGEPEACEALHAMAGRIESSARASADHFVLKAPEGILPHLTSGLELCRQMLVAARSSELEPESSATLECRMQSKVKDFEDAIEALCAVECEATASPVLLTPGRAAQVTVRLWNRGPFAVTTGDCRLVTPVEWTCDTVSCADCESSPIIAGNSCTERRFRVTASPDAEATGPFSPELVTAEFDWRVSGSDVAIASSACPELAVAPAVDIAVRPETTLVSASTLPRQEVLCVTLRSTTATAVRGKVELDLPVGIRCSTESLEFDLSEQGEETSLQVSLDIERPDGSLVYPVAARVVADTSPKQTSNTSSEVISYPHIAPKRLLRPALSRLGVIDVSCRSGLRIGYVDTGLDNVANRLEQLGMSVCCLGDNDLSSARLGEFDTIVLGIRAYLARPKLASANRRLLQFVYDGGILVVQYNKSQEWNPLYAPYPLEIGRERVTGKDARMILLEPEHALMTAPNRLIDEDWHGWVQERGLYFASSWAPEYTPLVECADACEEPHRGAWLVAHYGAGAYIYNALSLYRQVDSLVAGGVRIMANMVSYRPTAL